MHIVILAATAEKGEKIQNALGDLAEEYTLASRWTEEVLPLLANHPPDLIVVDRVALAHLEIATLFGLVEPGRWPAVLLVDGAADAHLGPRAVQRLVRSGPRQFQIGDLQIDTRKRRAGLGEHWVTLPPLQYRLLLALAQRVGEVVSCQELLQVVWGYEAHESEARELVKVHIRQIRRRLGLTPDQPYIQSVRGFGYMLAPPEEDH